MQGRGTQSRSSEVMEILKGGLVSSSHEYVLSFWIAASKTKTLPPAPAQSLSCLRNHGDVTEVVVDRNILLLIKHSNI